MLCSYIQNQYYVKSKWNGTSFGQTKLKASFLVRILKVYFLQCYYIFEGTLLVKRVKRGEQ